MDNYYQRNMDHCDEWYHMSGVSYSQSNDIVFNEGSSAPTEPVTLAEAKNFCKIDIDEDDTLITQIITMARQMCEDFTAIGFVRREVTATFNNQNGGYYLPYGPVSQVISTTDGKGTAITSEILGGEFKQVISPRYERMIVTYEAGYDDLPAKLKLALLNAIYYLYDNRAVAMDNIGPIAKSILKPISRV